MVYKNTIDELVNEQISGICFVRDYIEIHFDGPIIRCFTHLIIERDGEIFKLSNPGFKDVLCSVINSEVEKIDLKKDILTIVLKTGHRLKIPLIVSGDVPEALHFVPGKNQPIQVW